MERRNLHDLRWFPEVWKTVVLFPHTTMKVIV